VAGLLLGGVLVVDQTSAGAAPGDLDTGFSSDGKVTTDVGTVDAGRAVAVQSDGKIVVAGYAQMSGTYAFLVVRYSSDGSLDTSFSGDGVQTIDIGSGHDLAYAVALQSDGKVVVGGVTGFGGANSDMAIARLTSAGELDTTFSTDGVETVGFGSGDDVVAGLTVGSSGEIVVAGYGSNGSNFDVAVARLTSAGVLDTSFSGDGKVLVPVGSGADYGNAVAVAADGDILVAGSSHNGSDDDVAVVRLTSAGALDTSFSGDGKATVAIGSGDDLARAVVVAADGGVVVAGTADVAGGSTTEDVAVVRLTSAGALDTSFSGDGKATVAVGSGDDEGRGLAVLDDGRIVVVGESHNGSDDDVAVVRLTSAGALDTSFSGDGKVTVAVGAAADAGHAVAVSSSGQLVVVGSSAGAGDDDVAVVVLVGTSVPGPPTGLSATAGAWQVVLAWTAPASDGDSAITGYRIQKSADGTTWTDVVADTGSTATGYTVTGLVEGVESSFRVSAINGRGVGPASGVVAGTPQGLPGAPSGLIVVPGPWRASMVWTAPSSSGGAPVTSYAVEVSTDGGGVWSTVTPSTGSADTSYLASGLDAGIAHRFRVSARTSVGIGPASPSVEVTPYRTPAPPTGLVAEATAAGQVLRWSAPVDTGGSPILRYMVSVVGVDGAVTRWLETSGPVTEASLVGLPVGSTLSLFVEAVNAAGTSPASAVTDVTIVPLVSTTTVTTTTTSTTVTPTTTTSTTVAPTTTAVPAPTTTAPPVVATTTGPPAPPTTSPAPTTTRPGMVPPRPVYIG